jgi:lipoate-protein ligase A
MLKPFRVLDSGVLEGRLNIAIGQAIVEAHQQGKVPDTLRFLRFPPTALVGRHQALGQEIDLDYCRSHGVGVARRITGGGAIFMEPGLLGWELAFHRQTLGVRSLPDLTREICEAAADGISTATPCFTRERFWSTWTPE